MQEHSEKTGRCVGQVAEIAPAGPVAIKYDVVFADHIIDIGPEGGFRGGNVIATGTPEEVAQSKVSFTAKFLREELAL